MLALLDLQKPFEVETTARDYAMGAILLQEGKPIFYHSKNFSGAILNYPTYDKEMCALVQAIKKWKHYLIRKETIIYIDHQPLKYLQTQSKLQQNRHYRWLSFLQQFHLVIKYKKRTQNKVVGILSRPLVTIDSTSLAACNAKCVLLTTCK